MKAFTIATNSQGFLESLKDSASKFGYDLKVLGEGQPWAGFTTKFRLLRAELLTLENDEPVILVDAFDTIFVKSATDLKQEYDRRFPTRDGIFVGVEHRREHSTLLFWKLSEIFRVYHAVSHKLPIFNCGVLMGSVKAMLALTAAILNESLKTNDSDDQRILNTLVGRYTENLKTIRFCKEPFELVDFYGFHAHCDRSIYGPLRLLFTNLPRVPIGPLLEERDFLGKIVGYFIEGSDRNLLRIPAWHRAFILHGIFSTDLGPFVNALGIKPSPDSHLSARRISQTDVRFLMNTFSAVLALVAFWTVQKIF